MVLQLSETGVDYEGAEFLFVDDISVTKMEDALNKTGMIEPPLHGGAIFDAEIMHAVKMLRRGQRIVLAVEFWPLGRWCWRSILTYLSSDWIPQTLHVSLCAPLPP